MPLNLHKCDRWQCDTPFAWGLYITLPTTSRFCQIPIHINYWTQASGTALEWYNPCLPQHKSRASNLCISTDPKRSSLRRKANCKTRNRRVSIPLWVALSTLHWPSAKDTLWLRPNWRAPGYIDYVRILQYIVYLAYSWGARYAVIVYFYLLQ